MQRAVLIGGAAHIAFEEDAILIALLFELQFAIAVDAGVLFSKGFVGKIEMLCQFFDFNVAQEYISSTAFAAEPAGSTMKVKPVLVPRLIIHDNL